MSNFETWWEREGQEFLYALNTTTDDDIKLVAEFAWKDAFAASGKPIAEQAEQQPVGMVIGGVFEPWNDDILSGAHELYAVPFRTKELTDDEILAAWESVTVGFGVPPFANMRAVIAADREKNK